MNIYTIMDLKAGYAQHLYLFRSDDEARRSFAEIATDPQTQIGKYPEDFAIFKLGAWDGEKLAIDPIPAVCIAKAIEFKKGN